MWEDMEGGVLENITDDGTLSGDVLQPGPTFSNQLLEWLRLDLTEWEDKLATLPESSSHWLSGGSSL